MPRYYFHYRDPCEHLVADRVGSSHSDLEAAEREAELMAREILLEELQEGRSPYAPRCIEIEDAGGEVVLYLPFWAAAASLSDAPKAPLLLS